MESSTQSSTTDTSSSPSNGEAAASVKTITVTAKAIKEIRRIQTSDPETNQGCLRVQVVGGGCSGMSYKLGFDKEPLGATDKVFEQDGIKVIVDSKSFLFLAGTELDFSDGLNGTGFTFTNPNAKRTCGCGTSFSA